MNRPILTILALFASACAAIAHDVKGERFFYDPVDRLITGQPLDGDERYEPSLTRVGDETWLTTLEFTPGEGDRIRIEKLGTNESRIVVGQPGQYRRPTLTADAEGRIWLSYEALADETWDVWLLPADGAENPRMLSQRPGNAINHVAAALPEGGLAFAWQEDRGGQWDIACQTHNSAGNLANIDVSLSDNPLGDWHPGLAVDANSGRIAVAWDAYDGVSFSVRLAIHGETQQPIAVTDTGAFEGRAQAIFDREGRLFVAWEEGARNWGKEYRRFLANPPNFDDERGGLHRFRLLRLAEIGAGAQVRAIAVPMPSLDAAATRKNARPRTNHLGLFYERSRLAVDSANRLWLVYRHYFFPEVAYDARPTSHIEEGWRLYARCLHERRWSDAIGLEPTQRDGMQRLALAPNGDALTLAWTVGRTHRGAASPQRGVVTASVNLPQNAQFRAIEPEPHRMIPPSNGPGKREPRLAKANVGGTDYEVFFGDLHRHTDLSLCRVYFDGSIDDAYRYAIEAGELDFLGITDHARDIANGNVRSQLWWRSIKEVTRHRLTGKFYPMFAFERSHGETDHNVVTLDPMTLRPHNPPLKDFWAQIDTNTFTIPHNPIRHLRAFAFHDDAKRPLLEIYQGCRANPMTVQAHYGLSRGHHMGFIGSSDHLATRTSYACVWSAKGGEEPIFRAMQARRTYGATAKMRLVFRAGEHWMGERVDVAAMPEFAYEVDGEFGAELDRIDVVRDGEVVRTIEGEGGNRMAGTFRLEGDFGPKTWVYIHALQRNGEQAWSSPIWLE